MLSHFSHGQLFATPWTVALQAPLSMGILQQEYWSELPCSAPRHLPIPEIEPMSLASAALAGKFLTTGCPQSTIVSPMEKKKSAYKVEK